MKIMVIHETPFSGVFFDIQNVIARALRQDIANSACLTHWTSSADYATGKKSFDRDPSGRKKCFEDVTFDQPQRYITTKNNTTLLSFCRVVYFIIPIGYLV